MCNKCETIHLNNSHCTPHSTQCTPNCLLFSVFILQQLMNVYSKIKSYKYLHILIPLEMKAEHCNLKPS